MSDSLEKQLSKRFHPAVRAGAYFGALFSMFAAMVSLFSVFETSTTWGAFVALGRASSCVLLAWCFWYAGKYSLNPFKVRLFTK